MLLKGLDWVRRWLARGPLRAPLRATGIIQLGRRVYNRRIISRGEHRARVVGHRLRFVVTTGDEIRQIDGQFEEDAFLRRMLDALRGGDVLYDVGANIGVVSLLAASHAQGEGLAGVSVHSFEPEPRTAARLRENVRLNGFGGITVHEMGLGATSARIPLFVDGQTGRQTHSILRAQSAGRSEVEIELRAADEVAREAPAPTVMKIDVEGAEMDALRGAQGLLEKGGVRELFIEVHPDQLRTMNTDEVQLQRWLEDRGYRLVWSHARAHEIHQHYRRE